MNKSESAFRHTAVSLKSQDSRDSVNVSNQDVLSESEYNSLSSGSNLDSFRSDVEDAKWTNVSRERSPGFLYKQPDSNTTKLTYEEHLRASALLLNHKNVDESSKIALNNEDIKSTSDDKAEDRSDSRTSEKGEDVNNPLLIRSQFEIGAQDTKSDIVTTVSQSQIEDDNLLVNTDNSEYVSCQESFKSDVKKLLTETSPVITSHISSSADDNGSNGSKASDDSFDIITVDEIHGSASPDFNSLFSMETMKKEIREALKTDSKNSEDDEPQSETDSDNRSVNLEPAETSTCKTECRNSGIVKSVSTTEETSSKAATGSIQQVVEDLRRNLQEKYKKTKPHFPWHYIKPSFPEHLAFEFETLPRKQADRKKTVNIMEILPSTFGYKILVAGHPGFGKSFLCSLLAGRWASCQAPMKQFDLCLNLNLDVLNLTEINLFQMILLYCRQLLHNTENTAHLEVALKSYTCKIILILDGFDKISLQQRNAVLACLKTDIRLRHHTVLLTSRISEVEAVSDSVFNSVLRIAGFSYERLETLWFQTRHSEKLLCPSKLWKLHFLTGLSPLFTFLIWRAITIIDTEDEVKLYNLLELTMYFLADSLGINNEDQNRLYLKLGKLCYEALVNGYSLFSEELLRRVLEDDFDIFSRTFIFWKPQSPHGISVWHASSKVIVQYLATRYLRYNWLQQKGKRSKERFMKNVLNLGICGLVDYVIGRGSKEHAIYQVGFLPDFVLKYVVLEDGRIQSTVEMLHDTEENVEKSTVFDSCNVLLRTNKERLSRFSFVSHRSHEDSICSCDVEQCFQDVLNLLAFDECTVDYDIFCNTFENRHFLKVLVIESGENIVLSGVFRANASLSIDKVIIQFSASDFNMVLQGLVFQIVRCLPECDLSYLNKCANFCHFVYTAVARIIEGCTRKLVSIECFGNVEIDEVDSNKICTLAVSVEPAQDGRTRNRVFVEKRGLIPSEHFGKMYDPDEFHQCNKSFQNLFSKFSNDNCNYVVTVKISDPMVQV